MSQETVDFMYRSITWAVLGSLIVILGLLSYVVILVGDGPRDELIAALKPLAAIAVSSPVIAALIHQFFSALGVRAVAQASSPSNAGAAASVQAPVQAAVVVSPPLPAVDPGGGSSAG